MTKFTTKSLTKAAARLSLLLRTRGKTKMVRTALLRAGNAVARALAQANSPSFAPLQGGEKVRAHLVLSFLVTLCSVLLNDFSRARLRPSLVGFRGASLGRDQVEQRLCH